MSDVVAVKTHQPCDTCESSDAVAIYNDGHTYCFSCNTYGEAREDYVQPLRKQQPKTRHTLVLQEYIQGSARPLRSDCNRP